MKRLVSTFATVGLLLAAPAALAAAEGDYNGDGAVDEVDREIIWNAMNATDGDPGFVAAADHDGDGMITLVDFSRFNAILQGQ